MMVGDLFWSDSLFSLNIDNEWRQVDRLIVRYVTLHYRYNKGLQLELIQLFGGITLLTRKENQGWWRWKWK